jgi:glucose dehydrogenase
VQYLPGVLASFGLALSAAMALGVVLYAVWRGGLPFWRFLALLSIALVLLGAALERTVGDPSRAAGTAGSTAPPNSPAKRTWQR